VAIDVGTFKGEAPRIAPRLLPNDMGQYSGNARLLSGNLESWKDFTTSTTQTINANPLTIYYLNDQAWLTWNTTGVFAGPVVAAATLPTTEYWGDIASNGTLFACASRGGTGNVATSPDGLNWTLHAGAIASTDGWECMCYGNGKFVAFGSGGGAGRVATSTDGVTWAIPSAPNTGAYSCCAGNGYWLGVSNSGGGTPLTWSSDGVTWAGHSQPLSTNSQASAFGGGKFCIMGVGTSPQSATSTDAQTWTVSSGTVPTITGGWAAMAYGNGVFVAVSSSGQSATSSDGLTWTTHSVTAGSALTWIAFNGTYFVAGSTSTITAYYSANGVTWTSFSLTSGTPTWLAIAALGSTFAVVSGGAIYNQAQQITFGYLQYPITLPAIEVDVAKMAIAGDSSYRTIFCGTDVPRFTDLGLATGLVDGSSHPITGSSTLGSSTGPYPVYSRKLGVPNPTVAIANPTFVPAAPGASAVTITETFDSAVKWNLNSVPGIANTAIVVSGGNPGACLTARGINYAEAFGWKTQSILNTSPVTMAVQFSYQRLAYDYLLYTYCDFFFSLDSGASGSVVRLHTTAAGIDVIWAPVNSGVIGTPIATVSIASGSIPGWTVDADPNWTGAFGAGSWYSATLVITPAANPATASVTLTIKHGATLVLTQTQAGMPNAGAGYGMGCTQVSGQPMPDWAEVWFDNLVLTGTGPQTGTASLEATSYLYTLVNDLGQESGPSPAMTTADGSGVITRPLGQGVSVNLPGTLAATGVDTTYFQGGTSFIPTTQIAPNTSIPSPSMNLYRAVTGSTGTSFLLVAANIPFSGGSSTTYVDSIADAALSEQIVSLLWSPPPTTMLGILALPNGIYAGFHGNQLDLSDQGVPHAYPINYRLTFDWDIVGIEAIDSTVVVCTKKYPYLCAGTVPSAYSQTKASYPYACASKQSIQYLKSVGVVFATFEGLVAIAGPGNEKLLTESLFSKDEWLALNPASMRAAINDNRYFCWYTTVSGTKGGFYIDVNSAGSGKVSLAFHALARYNDPLTDTLYEVLDYTTTGTALGVIVGFNTSGSAQLPYVWKSKQFFVPWPTAYQFCRISADSYVSLTLNLFADGVQYGGNIAVTSQTEFTLPPPPNGECYKYFEFSLAGTDKVNRVQFAEDISEFS
jgi:hypothetical protein